MMTNSSRLDILKRKLKGKEKLEKYKCLFKNFKDYKLYDLEKSDNIINKLKGVISEQKSNYKNEFIEDENFIESDLLREAYLDVDNSSFSYIFTDNYEYCGIFLVNSKEAFENAFRIAKLDDTNTCFILDVEYKFSFTINYYNHHHNDYPNKFDIQRSI